MTILFFGKAAGGRRGSRVRSLESNFNIFSDSAAPFRDLNGN